MRRRVVLALLIPTFWLGLGACRGGASADLGPTAKVTSPDITTTTLGAVEREVEAAYLRSWDAYLKAIRTFDLADVRATHTGAALEAVSDEVADYQASGGAVGGSVRHHYEVKVAGSDRATVIDRYVNHLVLLDNAGAPIEADPNERVHYVFELQRIGGVWLLSSIDQR